MTLSLISLSAGIGLLAFISAYEMIEHVLYKADRLKQESGITGKAKQISCSSKGLNTNFDWIKWSLILIPAFAVVMVWTSKLLANPAAGLIIAVFGCILVPLHYRTALIERRHRALARQAEAAFEQVAGVYNVTGNLPGAIKRVAEDTSYPLGAALKRALRIYNAGGTLEEGLKQVADELGDVNLKMFARVAGICEAYGGDISALLEALSDGIAVRLRLSDELCSETSGPRTSAMLMAGLTPPVTVLLGLARPDLLDFFVEHPVGKIATTIIVSIWAISFILVKTFLSFKSIK